ncbi:DUF3631 domain-containing protein [Mycobacterium pseudokansasii]|uniref:DUF3631 domain-containing protein n=1 Tax=Mycobacterium pseudokansasii TaxID=2341080 RepID=UPI001FCE5877|nr:DUF3631 domain-containing protein [Mycobacterium pseudokansasii]
MATHALPAFECAPRLVITSPVKRCAKSRLLDITTAVCHSPLATVNATVAAIFHSIGTAHPPTLVIDEADTLFGSRRVAENNEDMRALLNAGHQRGRPALRCVGPTQTPTELPTFAMAALAGIGNMPDTITDRAVNITMRRRASGEKVAQFRSRRDGPVLDQLRQRLAQWAAAHIEALAAAEPQMPVEDRAADTWEPLIAVADAAGGHWPLTARAACRALVDAADEADEDRSHGVRLLADIKRIFDESYVSFLPSQDLVNALRRLDESPWSDFELNPSKLGHRLREFKIKTRHNAAGSARGYRLEDFEDAFERYTRQNPSEASESQVNHGFTSDGSDASDASTRQTAPSRQTENTHLPGNLTPLTGSDGIEAQNGPESRCACGEPLERPESITRGRCAECRASANNVADDAE